MRLIPAQYCRAYRQRNKTDAADAAALVEAARCAEIIDVPVKSAEQQAVQGLHRIRSQRVAARTARINNLRGLLREQGINLPRGSHVVVSAAPGLVGDETIPEPLRLALFELIAVIRSLKERINGIERQLRAHARVSIDVARIQQVPIKIKNEIERAIAAGC